MAALHKENLPSVEQPIATTTAYWASIAALMASKPGISAPLDTT